MPSVTVPSEMKLSGRKSSTFVDQRSQPSKGEARRLIKNGGVYINNKKVTTRTWLCSRIYLIDGRLIAARTWKKNKMLIRVAV